MTDRGVWLASTKRSTSFAKFGEEKGGGGREFCHLPRTKRKWGARIMSLNINSASPGSPGSPELCSVSLGSPGLIWSNPFSLLNLNK